MNHANIAEKLECQVREFHEAFDIKTASYPTLPDPSEALLRIELILEETAELVKAFGTDDLVAVADALADLMYVVQGAALTCGLHMTPILDEVHRSNMTKVGGHKSPSGKWVKPDTYSPANLKPIIRLQQANNYGLHR